MLQNFMGDAVKQRSRMTTAYPSLPLALYIKLYGKKAKVSKNWLETWWEQSTYLDKRSPIQLFNVVATGPSMLYSLNGENSQMEVAGGLTHYILKHWKVVRQEQLQPERSRGGDLFTMHQLRHGYSACRIPGVKRDSVKYYFKTDCEEELRQQFQYIRNKCDSEPKGAELGILSGNDRTTWAVMRSRLLALHPQNYEVLETIQSSIMAISLEDYSPNSETDTFEWMLSGDSVDRWFDKSLMLTCFKNGRFGFTMDHAPVDAMFLVSLSQFIEVNSLESGGKYQGSCQIRSLPNPEELLLHTDDFIDNNLDQAKIDYINFVSDVECSYLHMQEFGKDFLRQYDVHPDAFVQMALQYTYFRKYRRPAATCQPATTRRFWHGRTDSVRTCTMDVIAWCEAMLDDSVFKKTKMAMFKRVLNKHMDMMEDAIQGQACERILLGLSLQAQEEGLPTPDLFLDPAYLKSGGGSNYKLFASLSGYSPLIGGFSPMRLAPMCKDAFSISYNIEPSQISCLVTAWKSDAENSVSNFNNLIHATFVELESNKANNAPDKIIIILIRCNGNDDELGVRSGLQGKWELTRTSQNLARSFFKTQIVAFYNHVNKLANAGNEIQRIFSILLFYELLKNTVHYLSATMASPRDYRLFNNYSRAHNDDEFGVTVKQITEGIRSNKYKLLDYDKLRAATAEKKFVGHKSLLKMRKIQQLSKQNKQNNLLKQHRLMWHKEFLRLSSQRKRVSSEIEAHKRQNIIDTSELGQAYGDFEDFEAALESDFNKFKVDTTEPIWNLKEDLQFWIQENMEELKLGSPEIIEKHLDIKSTIGFVKSQQQKVMAKLLQEQLSLEQELMIGDLGKITHSDQNVSVQEGIPEEAYELVCPNIDLKITVLQEFIILDQKHRERLESLETEYSFFLSQSKFGGWTEAENTQFVHLYGQYPHQMANRRMLLSDRLQRHFCKKPKAELNAHLDWWESSKYYKERRKAIFADWQRDRHELMDKARIVFVEASITHELEEVKTEFIRKQHELCETLYEKVREWRDHKLEAMTIQMQMEERKRQFAFERMKSEEQRDNLRRMEEKKEIDAYIEEKERVKREMEECDKRRLDAINKMLSEQAIYDKQRIVYREEQLQKKIEKQKKSVAEKQEKEREKEERLEALREQVRIIAESDPERINQRTKAWQNRLAEETEEGMNLQKPLYEVHGFTSTQVTSDPRLRLEQKLREAGLHNSECSTYSFPSEASPPTKERYGIECF
ncbi:hypothetical protein ScPMuIL_016071 [Solemya velum]